MGKNPFFSPIASAANPIFSPAAIHVMGIVRRQIISVCARQIRIIFLVSIHIKSLTGNSSFFYTVCQKMIQQLAFIIPVRSIKV